MTQEAVARALGVKPATVSSYERNSSRPDPEMLKRIAEFFNCSADYLIGAVDEPKPLREEARADRRERDLRGLLAVGIRMLPVVGAVRAGQPIYAEQNIEEWLPVPKEMADQADFVLRVTGDSMVGAGIYPGDLVLMRRADRAQVRPGDIVVALIGDEATLKILQVRNGRYYLEPANPRYSVIEVEPDECRIQGVFVGLFTRRGLAGAGAAGAAVRRGALLEQLAAEEGVDAKALRALLDALKAQRGGGTPTAARTDKPGEKGDPSEGLLTAEEPGEHRAGEE